MDNKLKDLLQSTILKIKENLSEENLPLNYDFEYKNKNIILSVKDTDDELSFILSVNPKNTDITFSNFIFDGSKQALSKYLSTEEALTKTSDYAENLIIKADNIH